jgi:hypothetical protein
MSDFIIGMIIIACCVGSLYGTVYGWLAFGVFLLISGLISIFTKEKK